jgi:hypothetical protein
VVHLVDGARLVAGRHHIGDHLERRHPPLQIGYRPHGVSFRFTVPL